MCRTTSISRVYQRVKLFQLVQLMQSAARLIVDWKRRVIEAISHQLFGRVTLASFAKRMFFFFVVSSKQRQWPIFWRMMCPYRRAAQGDSGRGGGKVHCTKSWGLQVRKPIAFEPTRRHAKETSGLSSGSHEDGRSFFRIATWFANTFFGCLSSSNAPADEKAVIGGCWNS